MNTYCITGVSGYLGQLLANRLCRDPDARVVGIDQRESSDLADIAFYQSDIRDPHIVDILTHEKVDTLIHLAFYTLPEGNAGTAKSINIGGTRNVLQAVADAGIRRLILASSAAAYGSHPDNPVPMQEQQALRPNDYFYYSWHKAEQEQMTQDFLGDYPHIKAVILRPCALIGPRINNPTGASLRQKVLIYMKDDATPIQFIYEDDAAEAFYLAATGEDEGVFNIAAEGSLSYSELADLLNKKLVLLPYRLLAVLANIGRSLRVSPVSARTLRFIRNPIIVDPTKFSRHFGFKPQYNAREALMKFAGAR